MSGPGGELDQFGLCRVSKHQHMLERFPFTRPRWSDWLTLAPRWNERERLRLYHALAPFRDLGELDGVCAVILAASRRRRGRCPFALERLLVGLRYLEPSQRAEIYRDPTAWLERLRRLSVRKALRAHAATLRVRETRPALHVAPVPELPEPAATAGEPPAAEATSAEVGDGSPPERRAA
jgi:hypothetical protein